MIYPSIWRYLIAWPFGIIGAALAFAGCGLLHVADKMYGDEWDLKFHNAPTFKRVPQQTSAKS